VWVPESFELEQRYTGPPVMFTGGPVKYGPRTGGDPEWAVRIGALLVIHAGSTPFLNDSFSSSTNSLRSQNLIGHVPVSPVKWMVRREGPAG
jgi:hypothetical protein